jgi:uncharacterized protein (DUF697 family)
MPLGIGPREVIGLVRETLGAAASTAPLAVMGVLADELARALRAGGTRGDAVRVALDPSGAAALLVAVAGAPGEAEEHALRDATRRGTPIVVVQTNPRYEGTVPYVLAGDVVECPPGKGFPVTEIARVLAVRLGRDGIGLAARLPVLREAVAHELVRSASAQAVAVGVFPWRKGAHFPAMALLQSRLVLDLAAVYGETVDGQHSATELGAVAGTGLGFRALVRSLPRRLPLVGGVTGYVATRAIGEAAIRRHAAGT